MIQTFLNGVRGEWNALWGNAPMCLEMEAIGLIDLGESESAAEEEL